MKFIANEPALLEGRTLVVSDLHIGIELEYRRSGIKIPSQTALMEKRLDSLLNLTKATTLLICGDLKHKVPGISLQEQREIPEFLKHFTKKVKVEIVQGNHDADLKPLLPRGVRLHPASGVLKGSTFYMHGHARPSTSFLKTKHLVIGHVQPQIEIKDKLGYVWREQVWVQAGLDKKKIKEHFKTTSHVPELTIIPSFNPMAGGLALNKKETVRHSPVLKMTKLNQAKLYLLDGTFLGALRRL